MLKTVRLSILFTGLVEEGGCGIFNTAPPFREVTYRAKNGVVAVRQGVVFERRRSELQADEQRNEHPLLSQPELRWL